MISGICKKSKNEDELSIDSIYQYIPYKYLNENEKVYNDIEWSSCLKSIPFIRSVKNDKESVIQPKSIYEWCGLANTDIQEQFIFLPKYMYWWFRIQGGLNDFESQIYFVYYAIPDSDKSSKIHQNDDIGFEDVENVFDKTIEGKLFDCVKDLNPDNKKRMLSYKMEEEEGVGQILLDISKYLKTKRNCFNANLQDDQEQEKDFIQLLKNIFKSDEFKFRDRKKTLFMNYLGEKKCQCDAHCIGNSDLVENGDSYLIPGIHQEA